jgi:hypothetical protein
MPPSLSVDFLSESIFTDERFQTWAESFMQFLCDEIQNGSNVTLVDVVNRASDFSGNVIQTNHWSDFWRHYYCSEKRFLSKMLTKCFSPH